MTPCPAVPYMLKKTLKGVFAPPALSNLSRPELSSVLGGRALSQSGTADAGVATLSVPMAWARASEPAPWRHDLGALRDMSSSRIRKYAACFLVSRESAAIGLMSANAGVRGRRIGLVVGPLTYLLLVVLFQLSMERQAFIASARMRA
jgi:hypothetical protein